jgi:hypothetical protein
MLVTVLYLLHFQSSVYSLRVSQSAAPSWPVTSHTEVGSWCLMGCSLKYLRPAAAAAVGAAVVVAAVVVAAVAAAAVVAAAAAAAVAVGGSSSSSKLSAQVHGKARPRVHIQL